MSEDEALEGIFGDKDPFKILKDMYSDDKIAYITDLNIKEIQAISIVLFLADYLDLPEYKTFIEQVMKLKVSRDRKGRVEFLEAFRELKQTEEKKMPAPMFK